MDNLNYVLWGYYKYITNYFKLYLETFVLIVVWICTERPSTTESPATTTWPSSTTSSPVVPSKQFNLSLTFNVILTLLLLALLAFFLFRKFYSRSTPSTSHQSDVESAESQKNERDPLIVALTHFSIPYLWPTLHQMKELKPIGSGPDLNELGCGFFELISVPNSHEAKWL